MFGCCCNTTPGEAWRFLATRYAYEYGLEVLGMYSMPDWMDGFMRGRYVNFNVPPYPQIDDAADWIANFKSGLYGNIGIGWVSIGGWTDDSSSNKQMAKWQVFSAYPGGCWLEYASRPYSEFVSIPLPAPDSYTNGVDTGEHVVPEPDAAEYGVEEQNVTAHVFFWDKQYSELSFPIDYSDIYWLL